MSKTVIAALCGAGTILAGCASGNGNGPSQPSSARFESGTPVTLTQLGADSIALDNGTTTPVVLARAFGDQASGSQTFWAMNGSSREATLTQKSPDFSEGVATVYATTPAVGTAAGYQIRQLIARNAPTSGSASYTGEFEAYLLDTNSQTVVGPNLATLTPGTATLSADFGARSMSGTITGFSFNDITLLPSQISPDSSFAGATSGGGMKTKNGGYVASPGNYRGFILGAGQEGVVGGLEIPQSNLGTNYIMYGIFSARR